MLIKLGDVMRCVGEVVMWQDDSMRAVPILILPNKHMITVLELGENEMVKCLSDAGIGWINKNYLLPCER